ncbi:hypothetical protein [Paenibacillus beijingensis]|uniref:Citrate transporter-like domain-containing protein n=1 Tax=Paenibacillus beijingensis TaxID=1126833 RepID=A0A0D5NI78_9BACL|nr:hypothetical protein [Paenibacillus beijingensis]AJY75104.1 hypothetical protein VN24_11610 [Paenibacillus beijingensis]
MKLATKAIDSVLILSLAAVYLVLQLSGSKTLAGLLGVMVFIAIAILLPQVKGTTLVLTSLFVAGGAALLAARQASAAAWFHAAGMNVTLITLFVFAPLFGIPVRSPKYVNALKRFYQSNRMSRTRYYLGTQVLTQMMAVFINVGSVLVVYHLAAANPQPGAQRLLENALNRGFAGAIFWSPYFAAMTLVSTALDLPWVQLLPYVLGLSFVSIVVGMASEWRSLRGGAPAQPQAAEQRSVRAAAESADFRAQPEASAVSAPHADSPRALVPLIAYLASAIVLILLLERVIGLPMVLIVCFAAILYPLLWCVGAGALTAYRQGVKVHLTRTLPSLKKEITLFLTAGFFSGSIGQTSFSEWIPRLLQMQPLPVPLIFSLLTVIVISATSLIGLHPIVPVTILATGIDPASLGITPMFLAVLLLGSWGLSNPVSPVSAVNNLLAGLTQKDVFKLAARNYMFTAVMMVLLPLYLFAVRL